MTRLVEPWKITTIQGWNEQPITIGLDADGDLIIMDHHGYSIILSQKGEQQLREYLNNHPQPKPK